MNTSIERPDWEVRFDDYCEKALHPAGSSCDEPEFHRELVKDFIRAEREKAYLTALEDVEGLLPGELPIFSPAGGYVKELIVNGTRNQYRNEALTAISSLKEGHK